MWFTIAFFTVPIACILLIKAFTENDKNRKIKISKAIFLILIPIILLVLEIRNIKKIKQDIIGRYFSRNNTLVLNIDRSFRLKLTDSLVTGQWELDSNEDLIVNLNIAGKKSIQMGLTYFDGLPQLETNPYHLENKRSRKYSKIKNLYHKY